MAFDLDQMALVAKAGMYADSIAFAEIDLAGIEHARVLDVGCADGYNTRLKFAAFSNVEHVLGIDVSPGAIERACLTGGAGRFAFQCVSFEDYRGVDAPFDVVYFSHSFQHMARPHEVLAKAWTLLKPGGWVVIKTVDDDAKLSYPDPKRVMERLFSAYDQHVRPFAPHTRCTDRYNGKKCFALMRDAGLVDVRVRIVEENTSGLGKAERRAMFNRNTYFRRFEPSEMDAQVARELRKLLSEWEEMFLREDYFFSMSTFLVVGRKPLAVSDMSDQPVDHFTSSCLTALQRALAVQNERCRAICIKPSCGAESVSFGFRRMEVCDVGQVMEIELASFDDPWTPLAFLSDMRHNHRSRYVVAYAANGPIVGYIGWWSIPERGVSTITKIAVSPQMRGCGVGSGLWEVAACCARAEGAGAFELEVRASNAAARAFYQRLGFEEVGRYEGYYDAPSDNAVIMRCEIGEAGEKA